MAAEREALEAEEEALCRTLEAADDLLRCAPRWLRLRPCADFTRWRRAGPSWRCRRRCARRVATRRASHAVFRRALTLQCCGAHRVGSTCRVRATTWAPAPSARRSTTPTWRRTCGSRPRLPVRSAGSGRVAPLAPGVTQRLSQATLRPPRGRSSAWRRRLERRRSCGSARDARPSTLQLRTETPCLLPPTQRLAPLLQAPWRCRRRRCAGLRAPCRRRRCVPLSSTSSAVRRPRSMLVAIHA